MKLKSPDILELLRAQLGCEYISQLPAAPYGNNAVKELARLELRQYSLSEWENAVHYLTNEKTTFWSYDEVAKRIAQHQQNEKP